MKKSEKLKEDTFNQTRFKIFTPRDHMYKALVRTDLDYCDIIYHIPPKINPPPQFPTFNSQMEKLERVQYPAALAATGAWQGSNCSKLNEELGWMWEGGFGGILSFALS